MSRKLLNCWIVAMHFWIASHGRQYAWLRRSHAFRGKILHFGYAESKGWRCLRVIEYIPPKARLWSRDNFVLCFQGKYRVLHFRLMRVSRHETEAQALADHYWGRRNTH